MKAFREGQTEEEKEDDNKDYNVYVVICEYLDALNHLVFLFFEQQMH